MCVEVEVVETSGKTEDEDVRVRLWEDCVVNVEVRVARPGGKGLRWGGAIPP